MADFVGRDEAVGIGDVERRDPIGADPGEVAGVAAVVAPDDDHQVERLRPLGRVVEQRDDRVLALLRRAADGVERAEVAGELGLSVPVRHRRPQHFADLERLGHEHGRLVGAADPIEVAIGIEPGRDGVAETGEELCRAVHPERT